MSLPRHVPPAHSPLPPRALTAGLRAALGGRGAEARVRERVLCETGGHDVVLTASGTAALTLALRAAAAGRRGGAPVALPAYGCYDLATAALGAGLPVVLYDVDPATLAPEPRSLQRALDAGPCALVCVPLFGLPVDVDALRPAADAAGALLVEDAAQGAGASLRGRPVGSLGSVSVLSFGRGKGRTGGGGGALVGNDAAGAEAVRRMRGEVRGPRAGWGALAGVAAQWLLARPGLYALPAAIPALRLGETVFRPPTSPTPLPRAAAAVLDASWEAARREAGVRRRNAARLAIALDAAGLAPPQPLEGARPGWLRLPVVAPPGLRRRASTLRAARLGVAGGYPRALCDLDPLRPLVLNPEDAFDGARELAAALVTLPTHSLLSERDLRALEAWVWEGWAPARPPPRAAAGTAARTPGAPGRGATG